MDLDFINDCPLNINSFIFAEESEAYPGEVKIGVEVFDGSTDVGVLFFDSNIIYKELCHSTSFRAQLCYQLANVLLVSTMNFEGTLKGKRYYNIEGGGFDVAFFPESKEFERLTPLKMLAIEQRRLVNQQLQKTSPEAQEHWEGVQKKKFHFVDADKVIAVTNKLKKQRRKS